MITLTPAAIAKVKEVVEKEKSRLGAIQGLRIAVIGGGCSGFQYQMTLSTDPPSADDRVLEFDGIKIFIDPKSALYLNGMTVDYVEGLTGSGFKFNNPNASGSCGCGESFNV